MSSVGISTLASAVAFPEDEGKLISVIRALKERSIPFVVLGRMSNVLFKEPEYNGVVVKTTRITTKSVAENILTLSCGAGLASELRRLAELSLGGMEGLSGIPATVGGMVKRNAGAFGYEIFDRFKEAICYLPSSDELRAFSKEDMRFSYRTSALCHLDAIVLRASFELASKPRDEILSELEKYKTRRTTSQPLGYPSLGSVFKRYNGVSAGYYIDKAGLKGCRIGGACVSEKHAGFILNMGGATAYEYLSLVEYVKNRVYSEFGIMLEEEIEII